MPVYLNFCLCEDKHHLYSKYGVSKTTAADGQSLHMIVILHHQQKHIPVVFLSTGLNTQFILVTSLLTSCNHNGTHSQGPSSKYACIYTALVQDKLCRLYELL